MREGERQTPIIGWILTEQIRYAHNHMFFVLLKEKS